MNVERAATPWCRIRSCIRFKRRPQLHIPPAFRIRMFDPGFWSSLGCVFARASSARDQRRFCATGISPSDGQVPKPRHERNRKTSPRVAEFAHGNGARPHPIAWRRGEHSRRMPSCSLGATHVAPFLTSPHFSSRRTQDSPRLRSNVKWVLHSGRARLDADSIVANANPNEQFASGCTGPFGNTVDVLVTPLLSAPPRQTVHGNGREGLDRAPARVKKMPPRRSIFESSLKRCDTP